MTTKIDLKDKKILSEIEENCRIPLTKLAKKVGLSRDGIKYRIKNYEKNGIIQGYRTQVDLTRLGYKANHLFIKLSNPAIAIEKEIIRKLKDLNFVRTIIKFNDNYDLEVAFVSQDIFDLDEKITKIITICKNHIQDYEILTLSKTFVSRTFPESFLKKKMIIENKNMNYKIDKKDIEILKLIGNDAQIPLYEIADKIKLSPDAVSYRIKNLVKSGVIQRFVPDIDLCKLNYLWYVVLLNIPALDKRKEEKLNGFFLNDKNTVWATKAIGKFNVLAYFFVTDIKDLHETLIKLRSLFPSEINNYESLVVYKKYKYTYFPKGLF